MAAPFNHNCENRINDCQSVRRLIMILDWYRTMRDIHSIYDMDKMLIEYVDHYTNLLNDYQHVLTTHLNQDRISNDTNFMQIYNKITKYMENQCDIKTCKQYIRMVISPPKSANPSLEDALMENQDINNSIDTLEANDNRNTVNFYIELLDVIHCYFMHSMDLGLRFIFNENEEETLMEYTEDDTTANNNDDDGMVLLDEELIIEMDQLETKDEELISINSSKNNHYEISTTNNKQSHFDDDDEMKVIENLIGSKRDNFKTMRGIGLSQHSKFVSDISCKKGNNDNNNDEEDEKNEDYMYEYDFGNRFYFWRWYKDNENEDIFWNPGKKYKELYITPKYGNLKQEISDNKLYNLNMTDYDRTYGKAVMYQEKSDVINTIRSSTVGYGNCHYDIPNNEVLRIQHIMSIMLYTDHQHLSLAFSMSFRKESTTETMDQYKKRKSEFAHWTRLMRETVELYGTTMEESKLKTFYTGLSSQVVFNKFRPKITCPISTSPQLSVIMMFGQEDDGIILDLAKSAQAGNKLKVFNCSLFSCYGEEDERLLCGGFAPIQMKSIRVVKHCKNYQHYLISLGYFDAILDGAYEIKNKCTTSDFETIDNLIQQLMITSTDDPTANTTTNNNMLSVINGAKYSILPPSPPTPNDADPEIDDHIGNNIVMYPVYITEMFKQFVVRKESIYIDLQGLNWHYKSFISLLISPKCNNLVKFSFLATLFVNLSKITVKMLLFDSVSKSYIAALIEDIIKLNELKVKNKHKLKIIKLELIRVNVNSAKWKEFETTMNSLNCNINLIGKGHEGYKELLITLNVND